MPNDSDYRTSLDMPLTNLAVEIFGVMGVYNGSDAELVELATKKISTMKKMLRDGAGLTEGMVAAILAE